MRNLHMHAAGLANRDRLAHRLEHVIGFVADV
jgi:hypothetical protein